MKRCAFILAALVAVWLVTPPFLGVLHAGTLNYGCTSGGAGDDGLDSPFTNVDGLIVTSSNRCIGTDAAENISIVTEISFGTTHFGVLELTSGYPSGLCVRVTGTTLATFNGYCYIREGASLSRLYSYVDGTPTQIGSDYGAVADTVSIQLDANGTSIQPYHGATPQTAVTDTAHAAGRAGIYIFGTTPIVDGLQVQSYGGCLRRLNLLGVSGC